MSHLVASRVILSRSALSILARPERVCVALPKREETMAAPVHIPAPDSNAATSTVYHASPPLGLVGINFTVLFGAGLFFVISFRAGQLNFPGPWESADTIVTYFQTHS